MAQPELSAELVSTALRAAEKLGRDVADVPVGAIATGTVPALYRVIAHAVSRTPRLAPAMSAEAFSRADSPAVQTPFAYKHPPGRLPSLKTMPSSARIVERARDVNQHRR